MPTNDEHWTHRELICTRERTGECLCEKYGGLQRCQHADENETLRKVNG